MNGNIDNGFMDETIDGCMSMDSYIDGWMNGRIDGWVDE